MSRDVKSKDHNYLITSTNFEKLSEELRENEVLLVIFRTGYCGINVHIAAIRSANDFAQLQKNLIHILVEQWHAVSETVLKELISMSYNRCKML